jgi:branched-chain amino acid transport system ATP-binding protein
MATIPEAATRHGSHHCSRSRAPVVVGQVFATIRRLREQGLTTLLVEQHLKQALEVADRGCVVETGRVALRGSRAGLLDDPAVRAVYLGI